jgi:putative nucleotidyltransferase with HDIG domain
MGKMIYCKHIKHICFIYFTPKAASAVLGRHREIFSLAPKETRNIEIAIAFTEALDAKDRYTAGHSRRVMEYSLQIAKYMSLPANEIERLKMSALLHDIGKIGIPDSILQQRHKLSAEDYAVIKRHPEIGANILKSIGSFDGLVSSIYYHHERYDGSGYPHGLRGEQIPLGARIIAAADSFDAMTSGRSYRSALSFDLALVELKFSQGVQLDPHITEVFIGLLRASPPNLGQTLEPEWYI